MHRAFLTALFLVIFPVLGMAQSDTRKVLGTGEIEGRRVLLLGNGNWVYEDETQAREGCANVAPRLWFCGVADGWSLMEDADPSLNAQFLSEELGYSFAVDVIADRDDQIFDADLLLSTMVETVAAFSDDAAGVVPQIGSVGYNGTTLPATFFTMSIDGHQMPYVMSVPRFDDQYVVITSFGFEPKAAAGLPNIHANTLSKLTFE